MNIVHWIGLDPGESTGLAHVVQIANSWELRSLRTVEPDDVLPALRYIRPSALVVEAVPVIAPSPQTLWLLEEIVRFWGRRAGIWIVQPGQWKPVARRLGWRQPEAKDDHQRDAYNLLRWLVLNRLRQDIGALSCRPYTNE